MPIETPEEAVLSQKEIEHFARLAYVMIIAVERLEDAFYDLADYPENLGEAMPQLRALANITARIAHEWARISNSDFNPSPLCSASQQQ
jgi:hypothetical protein